MEAESSLWEVVLWPELWIVDECEQTNSLTEQQNLKGQTIIKPMFWRRAQIQFLYAKHCSLTVHPSASRQHPVGLIWLHFSCPGNTASQCSRMPRSYLWHPWLHLVDLVSSGLLPHKDFLFALFHCFLKIKESFNQLWTIWNFLNVSSIVTVYKWSPPRGNRHSTVLFTSYWSSTFSPTISLGSAFPAVLFFPLCFFPIFAMSYWRPFFF